MDISKLYMDALLARAAYATGLFAGMTQTIFQERLLDLPGMTKNQAELIASTYLVISQDEQDNSGFSATMFQEINGAKKYSLAMRGSQSPFTEPVDWYDANLNNGIYGIAFNQVADMLNFYIRLTNTGVVPQYRFTSVSGLEKNQQGVQIEFETDGRYLVLVADEDALGLGINGLDGQTDFSVSGHSLGGHLASVFTLLFPLVVSDTSTFDSGGIIGESLEEFLDVMAGKVNDDGFLWLNPISQPLNNVDDIRAPLDPVSLIDAESHLSRDIKDVFIESTSPITSHSLDALVDSLALMNFLNTLDSSMTVDLANQILKTSSTNIHNSLESTMNFFSALFNQPEIEVLDSDHDVVYSAIDNILENVDENTYSISLVGSNVVEQAITGDKSAIYALLNLQPFMIKGNNSEMTNSLYAAHNQNGELDVVNYSGSYFQDRQALLERVVFFSEFNFDLDLSIITDGFDHPYLGDGLKFIDKSGSEVLVIDQTTLAEHLTTDEYQEHIIFGSAYEDSDLIGFYKNDHIYGMAGNDVITGNGGDDYLEGGEGRDFYIWKSGDGSDTIRETNDGKINSLYVNTIDIATLSFTKADGKDYLVAKDYLVSGVYSITKYDDDSLNIVIYDEDHWESIKVKNFVEGDFGINFDSESYDVIPPVDETVYQVGSGSYDGVNATRIEENLRSPTRVEAGADKPLHYHASIYYSGAYAGYSSPKSYWFDGSNYDDWLVGGDWEANQIEAGGESNLVGDVLNGKDGDDMLVGNRGILYGTLQLDSDRDVLIGGRGNDVILGGSGDDYIYGTDSYFSGYNTEDYENLAAKNAIDPELDALDFENVGDSDYLKGGAGEDLITAGSYNDYLFGGADNDILMAGVGQDVLHGDGGDDQLFGDSSVTLNIDVDAGVKVANSGASLITPSWLDNTNAAYDPSKFDFNSSYNDVLDGGLGDDYIYGEIGSDIIFGGAGNDYLFGDRINSETFLAENIQGYTFLPVSLAAGNIQVHGNDEIHGGEGSDFIYGNGGDDTLYGDGGDDVLWGGDFFLDQEKHGNNTIYGGMGSDTIISGSGDDSLYGGTENDTIFTGDGDDTVNGGAGADVYVFGAGMKNIRSNDVNNDRIFINDAAAEIRIYANSAAHEIKWVKYEENYLLQIAGGQTMALDASDIDRIHIALPAGTAISSNSSNTPIDGNRVVVSVRDITVNLPDNTIAIDPENPPVIINRTVNSEAFKGGAVADVLKGSFNHDLLVGGDGDDVIEGMSGDDILNGNAGNDMLMGGLNNDVLSGGSGDDFLHGGGGSDSLYSGIGMDELNGGKGKDFYIVDEGVKTLLFAVGGGGDQLIVVHENAEVNVDLHSVSFAQVQWGKSNTHYALFLSADDYLLIDKNDEQRVQLSAAGKRISLTQFINDHPNQQIPETEALPEVMLLNAEAIYGNEFVNDVLEGDNELNDYISGLSGNDNIFGFAGNDELFGGADSDQLYGGLGTDTLYGDGGNDFLYGGDGTDFIYGGSGDDVIDGGSGNDVIHIQEGSDTVIFAEGSGHDRIEVSSGGSFVQALIEAEVNYGQFAIKHELSSDEYTLSLSQYDSMTFRGSDIHNVKLSFTDKDGLTRLSDLLANIERHYAVPQGSSIVGSDRNDYFYANGGNDQFTGGLGHDKYFLDASGRQSIIELANEGVDSLVITAKTENNYYDLNHFTNVENLIIEGDAIELTIVGSELDNVIKNNASFNPFSAAVSAYYYDAASGGNDILYADVTEVFVSNAGDALPIQYDYKDLFVLDFGNGNSLTFNSETDLYLDGENIQGLKGQHTTENWDSDYSIRVEDTLFFSQEALRSDQWYQWLEDGDSGKIDISGSYDSLFVNVLDSEYATVRDPSGFDDLMLGMVKEAQTNEGYELTHITNLAKVGDDLRIILHDEDEARYNQTIIEGFYTGGLVSKYKEVTKTRTLSSTVSSFSNNWGLGGSGDTSSGSSQSSGNTITNSYGASAYLPDEEYWNTSTDAPNNTRIITREETYTVLVPEIESVGGLIETFYFNDFGDEGVDFSTIQSMVSSVYLNNTAAVAIDKTVDITTTAQGIQLFPYYDERQFDFSFKRFDNILLEASDAQHDLVSISDIRNVANLYIVNDKENFYVDVIDPNISASFEYQLYDGQLTSDYATATIALAPGIIAEELFRDWPMLSKQHEGEVLELMSSGLSVQELINNSLHGGLETFNYDQQSRDSNSGTPSERSRNAGFSSGTDFFKAENEVFKQGQLDQLIAAMVSFNNPESAADIVSYQIIHDIDKPLATAWH